MTNLAKRRQCVRFLILIIKLREDIEDAEKRWRKKRTRRRGLRRSRGGRKWIRGRGKSNNNGSTGQQLVYGCILIIPQAARASSNLVVSLFLFSSLLLEPRCTTEMRRNKNRRRTGGTAHRFSPLNRVCWLQHRFAPTSDRFSLLSSLLRFLCRVFR